MSVIIFLVAIVGANLSAAYFGPWATPINAFVLIGLDITLRDRIHEQWHGRRLVWKMGLLIALGGGISYAMNAHAFRIAIASFVAFSVAAGVDAALYEMLFKSRKLTKMNVSNVGAALADSVLFPTIAFGTLMPLVVLSQLAAKVGGGFLWSLLLTRRRKRETP